MAFISNRERDTLVKKNSKSYTARKVFFFIATALTLAWLILIVVFSILGQSGAAGVEVYWENGGLTGTGIAFIVITAVIVAFDILMVILMLTVVSPKKSMQVTKKLQSSALSGVKTNKRGTNVAKATRDRTKTTRERRKSGR